MAAWLEVSLTVEEQLAEAVAEILSRYIPQGVVIESTQIQFNSEGEGKAIGPLRVRAYLPADEKLEITQQAIEQALKCPALIQPIPPPTFTPVQVENWAESWKQHYHPISVGKQLLILPAWLKPPVGERRLVRINPGPAFGTGTHPTTRLCLELLEQAILSSERPPAVIDVGCGSGILAIAAAQLGAVQVLGVDTDPQAVESARENVRLNKVQTRVTIEVGSVPEILKGNYHLRQASLVLANILAPTLIQLLDEGLADLLAPEGVLLLSGILAEQEADMTHALRGHKLQLTARRQWGDWTALRVTRPG